MAKRKTKCKYMHLMDGRPAYFGDGEQIYFASHSVPLKSLIVGSLKTIRAQQKASRQYRESRGWEVFDYTYLRVTP